MPLPTLDDFKDHLNVTASDSDLELSDVLAAAVDVVEGIVGPISTGTMVTETHYGLSSDVLVLRRVPVMALTSVSARTYPGTAPTSFLLSDFDLDPASGVVRLANGSRFGGDLTVTYTVGRNVLPPAIHLATLIVGKYMWETQRPASSARTAGAAEPVTDYGYSPGLPERAKVLLEPFARGPQIA